MSFKANLIFVVVAAGALALPPLARAEEFIEVNGLPCGDFCRAWMGIKLPPKPEAAAPLDRERGKPQSNAKAVQHAPRGVDEAESPVDSETRRVHKARRPTGLARSDDSPGAEHEAGTPPARLSAKAKHESHDSLPDIAAAPPKKAALAAKVKPAGAEKPAAAAKPDAPTPTVAAAPAPATGEARGGEPPPSEAAKPGAPAPTPEAAAAAKPEGETPSAVAAPTPVTREASAADKPAEAAQPETAAPSRAEPPTHATKSDDSADAGDAAAGAQIAKADPSAQEVDASQQVLVVVTGQDIKSVADLKYRAVVVSGLDAISDERLAASFAAAGASGLRLTRGADKDIDKLWNGEVAAAIVAAAPPKIAAGFGPIPGYQVLLVPTPPLAR